MGVKLTKICEEAKEYFLGTQTRKFYNASIAIVGEFAEDDKNGRAQIGGLKGIRNTFLLFGKYLPNLEASR